MKLILAGLAGLALAGLSSAALTQTLPPQNPEPAAEAMPMPPAEPPPANTSEMADTAPALVMKDGKWWNGDRRATKSEIAAFQAEKQKGSPR